jgi:hypothetical protein
MMDYEDNEELKIKKSIEMQEKWVQKLLTLKKNGQEDIYHNAN